MSINASLWSDFIGFLDYVLLPFYILILYAIIRRMCDRLYPRGHAWRKYFLTGFWLKIAGSLFIGMIYQYYYRGGDTSAFFYHAKVINQSIDGGVFTWLKLILHIPDSYDPDFYEYIAQMMWYKDPSSYFVSALAAFIGAFTFNTFLPTSIIFAALSFTGNWAMFRTLASQYPHLSRSIATATLFIPSTLIWGSGIFKDTICLAAVGWLTYCTFKVLVERQFKLKFFLIAAIGFLVLSTVRVFVLLVFLPALAIWIQNIYANRIRNRIGRNALRLAFLGAAAVGFVYFTSAFATTLGRYSLDNVATTSAVTRDYIQYVTTLDQGSAYSLGEIDPTPQGMIAKFPAAVNVALFRPYLWEARKVIVFFNSIEAFLLLFFTVKVLFSVGPFNVWRSIRKNPEIQFCLIVAILMAFAVGISAYNFGALSRYRIICLPFYATALTLIYYSYYPPTRKLFQLRLR